eukprot:9485318-Pyramimonas_sp.AAC.1
MCRGVTPPHAPRARARSFGRADGCVQLDIEPIAIAIAIAVARPVSTVRQITATCSRPPVPQRGHGWPPGMVSGAAEALRALRRATARTCSNIK